MFSKIFAELARKAGKPSRLMIDATHPEGASHGCEPFKKRACSPTYQAHEEEGGLNSKLHAVCDGQGRPVMCCSAKAR